jgi:Tfp pilus assembly protein PilO
MNGGIRTWAIACGAGMAIVLAGGWFLGVQPQVAAAATTAQNATNIESQNQATQIKLAELSKAAAKLDTMQATNAALLKSVPTILKPNTFIRRVNEVAALDGVTVVSVNTSDSVAYTSPVVVGGSDGVKAFAIANPAITAANFTAVPIVVTVTGTSTATAQFMHDIQNDERVFAISGVQISTDETGVVSSALNGYIYTLKR